MSRGDSGADDTDADASVRTVSESKCTAASSRVGEHAPPLTPFGRTWLDELGVIEVRVK
jgi:hypothetical protein